MTEEIVFKLGVEGQDGEKKVKNFERTVQSAKKEVDQLGKTTQKTSNDMKSSLNKVLTSTGSWEDKLKQLNKIVKETPINVRDMNKQIQVYQSIALEAGRTSPVGKQALEQAAQLRDRYVDIQNETKRLSDDQRNLKGVMDIGQSVVAGYGAVQGAMTLAGGASEEFRESMVKLQAVQTILVSLDRIRTSLQKESSAMLLIQTARTKVLTLVQTGYTAATTATTAAMKILKFAMLALPILAIIAGITALIGWLVSLFSETEKAEAMNNRLTASLERQKEALDRNSEAARRNLDNKIRMAKAEGATREEMHQLELEKLKLEETLRRKSMQNELEMQRKKKKVYEQAKKEENHDLARQIKDEIWASKKRYRDLKALDGQYQVDKLILEKEFANETEDIREKEAEKEKKESQRSYEDAKRRQEERLKFEQDLQRKIRDLYIASIEDRDIREMEQLKEKQKREREDLRKRFKNNTELLKQLEIRQAQELEELRDTQAKRIEQEQNERAAKRDEFKQKMLDKFAADRKAQLQGELIQMREDFDATMDLRKKLLDLERKQLLKNKKLTKGEIFKIEQEYDQKSKDLDTEKANHSKEMQKQAAEQRVAIEEGALNSISSLSDAVFALRDRNIKEGSKEEEKAAKRRFYFNKAVQLGGALIDAQKAITASLAQAPIAIGAIPNPAGIASLTFAATQSAAAITAILAQQYKSSASGGGTTISPPSVPTAQTQQDEGTSTLTSGLEGSGTESKTQKLNIVGSELQAELDNQKKAEMISTVG